MIYLKYEKVELNKSFDVFREKLIIYTIRESKNAKEILVLVQYMEDMKDSFDTKKEPKHLNGSGTNYEAKKYILTARVRQYIEIEEILV